VIEASPLVDRMRLPYFSTPFDGLRANGVAVAGENAE
jgi:hypothetical protein